MTDLPELPPGWVWTTLDAVAFTVMGQSPPGETYNTNGRGLPFYQGKAEFGDLYPTPVKWCSEPGKIAQADDILFSVRAPVGPTNLCREESCIGRGLAAIRPLGGTSTRYMLYYLRLLDADRAWDPLATGTTFAAISGDTLRACEIPLAPLAEQRRIVEVLEAQLTRLDAAVAALERARANLKRYRAAVLKAAVEGRLVPQDPADEPAAELLARILRERHERWEAGQRAKGKDPAKLTYPEPAAPDTATLPELPEGWVWASLDQLAWDAGYGTSERCVYDGSGPPVLRIPNVVGGRVSLDDLKFAISKQERKPEDAVAPNDLLIIRTNGSKSLVGKSALVTSEYARLHYFASYLIRFRLLPIGSIPQWIASIWDSDLVRRWIDSMAATSAGQYNVNSANLRKIPIAIPPATYAQRAVERIETELSICDGVELQFDLSAARASRLRQSLLSEAFAGNLVPQDPNDEPASDLLERIREARRATPAVRRRIPSF